MLSTHLKERRCLDPFVTFNDKSANFPLYNLAGQLVGFQRYTPGLPKQQKKSSPEDLKYFTYTPSNKVTAYGLHLLDKSKPYVFLVEGVFDACALHSLGYNALAVLTCDPVHLREWLQLLPYKKLGMLDGDLAGFKLGTYCSSWAMCPKDEDPSDQSNEELSKAANLLINQLLESQN